ncbi:MAG TPA: hypothetical protein VJ939_02780, partial [Bacteroidales bacterium]|nr:hypothetical protein [Bacteroidales bacterium]
MRKASLYIILFLLAGNVIGQSLQFDTVYVHNPDSLDGIVSVRWEIDLAQTWDSISISRIDSINTYRGSADYGDIQFIDNFL